MNRIERLASKLDDPLLVTGLVNVRYLTGLQSSNAAVLVDPDGDATLYTDFRYAEAASEIEGVTFHRTPRAVVPALAEPLSGRQVAVEERAPETVLGVPLVDLGQTGRGRNIEAGVHLIGDAAPLLAAVEQHDEGLALGAAGDLGITDAVHAHLGLVALRLQDVGDFPWGDAAVGDRPRRRRRRGQQDRGKRRSEKCAHDEAPSQLDVPA